MKSLKLLAIGNSFSVDSLEQYFVEDCINADICPLTVGNLYIGGCSLDMHYGNIVNNSSDYVYYKNTNGAWEQKNNTDIKTALVDEKWDIITVQQVSRESGLYNKYDKLPLILDYVFKNKTNPRAKIYFHMTWAYPQAGAPEAFKSYGYDQMNMYSMIADTTKRIFKENPLIYGVIPTGTAIQNLRSSYIGDNLTRDALHLDFDIGRYTAALTWYATLTGNDIKANPYIPKDNEKIEKHIEAITEAVDNAIKRPFSLTNSKYI